MKKNLLKSTFIGALLLTMILGAGVGLAQTSLSTSGTASGSGTATAANATVTADVPAGFSVIPANDADPADDQIVQLEQLAIQSISVPSTAPNAERGSATIYALHDPAGPCREYLDASGKAAVSATASVRSRAYPCLLAPSILYQITVHADTILLLKNRTRASISDFAVGDRINVFGFIDPGTSAVQALIMRDLDKPAVASYAQLEGLTVVSQPTSATAPATFRAARKGPERCLEFATASAAKGIVTPCPLGIDIATSAEVLTSGATADLYRPFRQYYTIQVSKDTILLNANRQMISLADIQAGDIVNVYGRFIPSSKAVEAVIVRDLSTPRSTGNASLVVYVTDSRIVCITAPCGQMNGVTVWVWSSFAGVLGGPIPLPGGLMYSQVTVNGQAEFKGLPPGTYVVRAGGAGSGYTQAEQKVALAAGQTSTASLFISKDDNTTKPKIQLLSPNGGETLLRDASAMIKWQADPSISNVADIYLVPRPAGWADCAISPPGSNCAREYAIARGVGRPDAIMCSGAAASAEVAGVTCGDTSGRFFYYWQNIPATLDKILLPDSSYRIKVCYAGTSICDWSDSEFTVITAPPPASAPAISSIDPGKGQVGVPVTLHGSGFTSASTVYFAGFSVSRTIVSSDTITFNIPSYYPWSCPTGKYCTMAVQLVEPGDYSIQVANENGPSNSVVFGVTP